VPGFVDLHCHFVSQIDDGCRNSTETEALLVGLGRLGFSHVVATPHMRPGMFDNTQVDLRRAYRSTITQLETASEPVPSTSLGSEHFFDALVVEAVHRGAGLPYRADEQVLEHGERHGGALLVEFHDLSPLALIEQQLFRLQTAGYLPVLAHPERYRQVWSDPTVVDRLQERGCVALLDLAAIVGKYGARAQETAQRLLSDGCYHAACSDAHRPSDVEAVERAMTQIAREYGHDELDLLLSAGPGALLQGQRPASL